MDAALDSSRDQIGKRRSSSVQWICGIWGELELRSSGEVVVRQLRFTEDEFAGERLRTRMAYGMPQIDDRAPSRLKTGSVSLCFKDVTIKCALARQRQRMVVPFISLQSTIQALHRAEARDVRLPDRLNLGVRSSCDLRQRAISTSVCLRIVGKTGV